MRRAVIAFAVASGLLTGLGAGLGAPAVAVAGEGRYYEDDGSYYDRSCDCRRSRGYWERPSDRRRYKPRYRRYRYDDGVSYYPGYGYYPDRGRYDRYDRHDRYDRYGRYDRYDGYDRGGGRDRDRSEWCARRYRSYDWRTGTYVGYDGVRRYCG